MTTIDHIIWATPDLDEGIATFRDMAGLEPAKGGSHPGLGTRNALLSLGEKIYLEILAPDPAQDLTGTYGAALAKLAVPGVFTFSVRTDDIRQTHAKLVELGVSTTGPIGMSRSRPDGGKLSWHIMMLNPGRFGWEFPFFIDWGNVPVHPANDAPQGCRLRHLTVLSPNAAELEGAFRGVGLDTSVNRAPQPGFVAALDTPRGRLVLNNAFGANDYGIVPGMLETMAQRTGFRAEV
jgi:glyoxalase-like protein